MARKTVAGVFENRRDAESAVEALRRAGFSDAQVSMVGRGEGRDQRQDVGMGGQDLSEGAWTGAGLGAAAGVLATAGALAIPGLGPLVAMGPLAATLGGAAAGGLAGGLLDYGIPEAEGRRLEEEVRRGRFLAVVDAGDKAGEAVDLLQARGARDVKEYQR